MPVVRRIQVALVASIIRIPLVMAEMDIRILKGSTEFFQIKRQCRYLAPETAPTLLRAGMINQDYLYGDEKNPAIEFIQTAFYSASENASFLQVNPRSSNFARFLTPQLVGQLLKILGLSKEGKDLEVQVLVKMIESSPQLQLKIQEDNKRTKSAREALDKYLQDFPIVREMAQLESSTRRNANLKKAKMRLQELKSTFANDEQYRALRENIKLQTEAIEKLSYPSSALPNFVKKLVAAFRADRQYLEQLLLSLGWLSGEGKEDLYDLVVSLPKACLGKLAFDKEAKQAWMKQSFSEEDFTHIRETVVQQSDPAKSIQYLIERPEELVFWANGISLYAPNALPTLGYRQVEFTHAITGARVSMHDRMEYAILNKMLNDLSGGPGNHFDVKSLEKNSEKMGYFIHPGLKEFLTTFSDWSMANGMEAHKRWASLLSSLYDPKRAKHFEFDSLFGAQELKTTVSNALEIYTQLFFHSKRYDAAPEIQGMDPKERLNRICEVLSRGNRRISWNLRGAKSPEEINNLKNFNTDIVLEFFVNDAYEYGWIINSDHSEVVAKERDEEDFRNNLGTDMARMMPLEMQGYLSWILASNKVADIIDVLRQKGQDKVSYQKVIRSISTEKLRHKLKVIGEFAELKMVREIGKMYKKFPTDLYSQRLFHATIADHNYPFPEIVTSRAGAKFRRAPDGWKDSRNLVWGPTLFKENGEDDTKLWADAVRFCLGLNANPAKERIVEQALNAREVIRQRLHEKKLVSLAEAAKLIQPISGYYLPGKEEFEALAKDLGFSSPYDSPENKYLPEFLKEIFSRPWIVPRRRFWSSSTNPAVPGSAFHFDGGNGLVDDDFQGYLSVRCVRGN